MDPPGNVAATSSASLMCAPTTPLTDSALAAVQALCINDDVLRLGSLPRINERCQELRAPKAKKQAVQEKGKVTMRLMRIAAPPEPSPSTGLKKVSCQLCSITATLASCLVLSAGGFVGVCACYGTQKGCASVRVL